MTSIPERSAEDRVAGILRVTLGQQVKRLPTLALKASRDWAESLGPTLNGLVQKVSSDGTFSAPGITSLGSLAGDAILEAIVSYDRSGALGGREWLEENADPEQLYLAFLQIGQVVFPFVGDVDRVWQKVEPFMAGLLALGASASPSSTNGRSPTGASIPGPSKSGSTPRS